MTAIPFLELSKKLAEKGIRISFISTPRNIQRLPSIPPNLAGNIKFVQLPLPSVHGLPENCEASIDLQQGKIQYLKKACDVLQAPFEKLVHKDPPDLILFDFIQCWAPETAAKFGVPFLAYSASTLCFLGQPDELKFLQKRTKIEDFAVPAKWLPFPSMVSQRPDQAAQMFGQRWAATLEGCDYVAVRSCMEFEVAFLGCLEELYQKPILPVGLLP
ncbi:putative udp-rhamnose:rhamnosyltransferase 1 [Quercus suber]|uniref:Udp-rhamnose:rhamnosyltransferase 1 n=1 Tax=Quercus suber TaxID=58331 RepID=A0AAW0JHJ6_QUESU